MYVVCTIYTIRDRVVFYDDRFSGRTSLERHPIGFTKKRTDLQDV